MKVQKRMLAAICAALSLAGPAGAAVPYCRATGDLLYCQDPGTLVRVAPAWVWMMTPGAGGTGGTPENKQALHANACSVMPEGTVLRPVQERKFQGRNDTYSLVLVSFDEPAAHLEDKYSPEGEYLGQKKVTYLRAWTFRKRITCGGE